MPIRILIVDDSIVIRRSLTAALSYGPELNVVGAAASGRIALMKMPLLRPDLVLLAVDLPGDDGLDPLAAMRAGYPKAGIVLLKPAGAGPASSAGVLPELGCLGCVTKPDPAHRSAASVQTLVAGVASLIAASPLVGAASSIPDLDGRSGRPGERIDVVAIGLSTGGPAALMELLPKLTGAFPVPIVVVQHMPAAFTRLLVERLETRCRIRVIEAASRQVLRPGQASIAPGDFHMTIERQGAEVRVTTDRGPRENSCRPSVDVLFRSVARAFGPHALAVVMTGMGRDGVAGCQAIRSAGGQVIVQDESTSAVWGMPGLVVKADLADRIVPLHGLAVAITERVSACRTGAGDLVGR